MNGDKLALGAVALLAVAGAASRKGSRSGGLKWLDESPTGTGALAVRWKAITHHGTYVFARNRPGNFGVLRYEYRVPVLGLDEVVDGVHSSDLEHYPVFYWWGGKGRWMHQESADQDFQTDWNKKEGGLINFGEAKKVAATHHLERRGIRGSRATRDRRVKLWTEDEAREIGRALTRTTERNISQYETLEAKVRRFDKNSKLRLTELYEALLEKYFAPEMWYWKKGQRPSIRGVPLFWPNQGISPYRPEYADQRRLEIVFSSLAATRLSHAPSDMRDLKSGRHMSMRGGGQGLWTRRASGDRWYDQLRSDPLYLELNDLRGARAVISSVGDVLKRVLDPPCDLREWRPSTFYIPARRASVPKSGSPAKGGWMTLAQVLKAEPEARRRKVSSVARSKRGFVRAYEKARTKGKLGTMSDPKFGQNWHERRDSFIARHMAQLPSDSNSSGWKADGSPTNRHLGLMMWAYTPTPAKTKEWLQSRGSRALGSRNSSRRFFQVTSPTQGLKVIKDKAITDNWKKSLRVRRKHPVAVLLPCAGTKPFPESPSHKHGYLEALDGLGVDLYVVSEPLGVVPYAWSRTWPNDSYDFPPKHLKGEARTLLVDRIGEWFDKVGSKYPTVVSALPIHHSKLVRDANDGGIALVDASMTACRNGSCSDRSFRATSDEYKKWLRRKVKQYV